MSTTDEITCAECGSGFDPAYTRPEDYGFHPEPNDMCESCLAAAAGEWSALNRQYERSQCR